MDRCQRGCIVNLRLDLLGSPNKELQGIQLVGSRLILQYLLLDQEAFFEVPQGQADLKALK